MLLNDLYISLSLLQTLSLKHPAQPSSGLNKQRVTSKLKIKTSKVSLRKSNKPLFHLFPIDQQCPTWRCGYRHRGLFTFSESGNIDQVRSRPPAWDHSDGFWWRLLPASLMINQINPFLSYILVFSIFFFWSQLIGREFPSLLLSRVIVCSQFVYLRLSCP